VASIKKRPDGTWRARYRDAAGKEHAAHRRTKAEAQAWLDRQTAALVRGDHADPKRGRQLFHDFALEYAESQDWKASSRESFLLNLRRIEGVLPKNARLSGIDELVIRRARVELSKTYAAKSVDLSMTYLTAVMRSAYRTRRIGTDPTIDTRSRRRRADDDKRVGPEDVPTREDVAAIWQATPSPYRAAIALATSGLRIGEVLGLTVDRIDLEERLVVIDRQLQVVGGKLGHTTPKNEKVREIKVPSQVALELRRHVRDHAADGLLFLTPRSRQPMRRDWFYLSAWKPALRAAGFADSRYKFHSLRHFCASSMLAEGINPMAVAGHLGDTLATLQRVYAHWLRDDRDVPADALERILATNLADFPRTGTAPDA
jgi:integrase